MATLNQQQLDVIKNDLSQTKEILTDAQVLALAQKVVSIVKIPFGTEEIKLKIVFKIIRLIEKQLYLKLPNEYFELLHDTADGLTQSEADALRKRLVPIINVLIDIPILTEEIEAFIIDLILGLIINAMVVGFKLDK